MSQRTTIFALIGSATVVTALALTFGGCSDDSATSTNPTVFTPGGPADGGGTTATGASGGPGDTTSTTDGGCPNKPAGCFCGTPTTQVQWLNRCTTAAALPVTLTVKPATTTDIP